MSSNSPFYGSKNKISAYMAADYDWSKVSLSNVRNWQNFDDRYAYAVLSIVHGRLQIEKNYCSTCELAIKKAKARCRGYTSLYYNNVQFVVVSPEQYNIILAAYKSKEPIDMSNVSLPRTTSHANKFVHVVWNKTLGQFVNAYETKKEALEQAQLESRKNPINEYLILSPAQRVYQPVNIQVEVIDPTAIDEEVYGLTKSA